MKDRKQIIDDDTYDFDFTYRYTYSYTYSYTYPGLNVKTAPYSARTTLRQLTALQLSERCLSYILNETYTHFEFISGM